MRVLSLFAGIGGFDLGLERAGGFKTVAFCEIDPFCRAVLAKHWPGVPCYDDVRTLTAECLAADGIGVDAIVGGFPCQDLSSAGKGAGLDGARSGLWSEFARLIGEIRPEYAIVENVAALLGRGLSRVLGDLAALGYDAEWHCIPASALGALHRRDRVWIMAYPDAPQRREVGGARDRLAVGAVSISQRQESADRPSPGCPSMADAERRRLQGGHVERPRPTAIIPPALRRHCGGSQFGQTWRIEPDVGRVAHGIPAGMDRLKGLGNAVVPQIPELIGRAILESLTERQAA